jgi:cell wall-associated NlpC family hydrolase
MPTSVRRALRHVPILVGAVLALTVAMSSTTLVTPSAEAMSRSTASRVLHIAAAKKGAPYRYGASGPRAFDCSGYTRWVFGKVGRRLPHNAAAQSRAVRHVKKSQRKRGDLVFFRSHGRVYHVGIYAGNGRIWHAPRPGQRVHKAKIWTRAVSYGRVR